MKSYFESGDPKSCSGCSACVNICPKHCLEFKPNMEGFYYPVKNLSLCIDCGLCEKVCSFSDNYTFETTNKPIVYAAYDKYNRIGSSSGGLFYTIAKDVIQNRKGWVYGAAFGDSFELYHIGVNKLQDLEKLRGSKYIQSKLDSIFCEIKQRLLNDSFVLFVGTPCQIAGLRSFLRKDFEKLLTIDLVCHGVPSQLLFNKHVEYLEYLHNAKLSSYQFRNNSEWQVCEISDFKGLSGSRKIFTPYILSPYLYSFMNAMTYRESCYECKFARVPRQGDITLADYWGVNKFIPDIDSSKGVSLVLINTDKGTMFWSEINQDLITYVSNISDASKYNHNLLAKTIRPNVRDTIYKQIINEGYEKIANTRFRVKYYTMLRFKLMMASNPLILKLIKLLKDGF